MAEVSGDAVSTPVIEVTNASVTYTIRHGRTNSLKETAINFFKQESSDIEVNALREVSFTLNPGEVIAIVGPNGAGKSTLLKLLARVLPPTDGRVIVRGSVAPMIELGAGFNPELSGLENIILYGVLLGRTTNEMTTNAPRIAEWAGLNEYIQLPVRTYSSGMLARLAFSIATDVASDLILIDEVLSVGDADFQSKSKERMRTLIQSNSAAILITHDMGAAREIATRGIWLDHGKLMKIGEINEVIDAYLQA
jgi:ABC-type polysaccharide/polyol phosphate transport system ATPase subunit